MKLITPILFFLWLLSLLTITFCSPKKQTKTLSKFAKTEKKIRYAKGFDIQYSKHYKTLNIYAPYHNSKETFSYKIWDSKKAKDKHSLTDILVPIKKMVPTSTTHIPMIELLGEEKSIVGFPHTQYISSKKTRKRIANGGIKEIGKESSLNTEILLEMQPDLVVGYSVNTINKVHTTLKRANIPVIQNGDWLEETPLGRAEWLKFFGVLYSKSREADSIFNLIEKRYIIAKQMALKSAKKKTILSGAIMGNDIWSLPAGESFVATFFKDANLEYLWRNTKGKGSISLSFESVLDKAQNADFWIAPGHFSTKKQLLKNNAHYALFEAFKKDQIYTVSSKKGKTGGILYYELAPTRPDLVVKDLIKITNPDLVPNYELTFFEKMK